MDGYGTAVQRTPNMRELYRANRPHSGHSHAFGSGYPATAVAGAAAAAATGLPKESFLTLFSKQGKVHREKPVGERRYTVVL